MGGRGSVSGLSGGRKVSGTKEQERKIQNIRRIGERDNYINLQFKKNKDGSINYSFEKERKIEHVHGGKMQDPSKNDIYERTEYYSGVIMKDGLIKRKKTEKKDRLVKRGRR